MPPASPTTRPLKDAAYQQLARIGKALASPKRLELLELLCQSPRTVEELAALADLSVANASQHLQVLRAARLVEAEKRGLHVSYRIGHDEVRGFVHQVRLLAEARFAELREVTSEFFARRDAGEGVGIDELLRRVRAGEAVLLDVRPAEEYRAGHIPGAISIPLPELKSRLGELPRRREIVAYCRGPFCVMAADAVAVLRQRGYRAGRANAGVLDWQARGWRLDIDREGSP
ncbi:MAG TPA: metalloregulator ArsR/SmtB family transcription factor [Haliangiales bacterium]|nr:metalloregulator ArsR/SmtB family transcription factor [Haliangiales bacterium]